MKDDRIQFESSKQENLIARSNDAGLRAKLLDAQISLDKYKFGYQFSWLGLPIIRLPDDIVVFQQLVWELKPSRIIEVGVARGGSVLLSASLLEILGVPGGKVIGVDIEIRPHNRDAIENHPLAARIELIEGDSVNVKTLNHVESALQGEEADIVVLDSNHTHDHVLRELEFYSRLLRVGGYLVCPDTVIEHFPPGHFADRPWDVGNNPLTAVFEFLSKNRNFTIDTRYSSLAAISESPSGYLVRNS